MKYWFPIDNIVVDTERNSATFANGHTADVVGNEFSSAPEATRFKFRGPDRERGETCAVLLSQDLNYSMGVPL